MMGKNPDSSSGKGASAGPELLIRAAQEVVALDGWTGATSRKIAQRANLNPALINYYFRSKDLLLAEALKACAAKIGEHLAILPSMRGRGMTEWMCQSVRALQDPELKTEIRFMVEATVHAPKDPKLLVFAQEQLKQFRALLAKVLREEAERGRLELGHGSGEQELLHLASALAALADGLAIQLALDPTLEVEAIVRATVPRLLGSKTGLNTAAE